MPKEERVVLNIKPKCPLSGMGIGTKVFDEHYCKATLCRNGMVHVYCLIHKFRGFIGYDQLLEIIHGEIEKAKARAAAAGSAGPSGPH